MDKGYSIGDKSFESAVKTLDLHFAKSDAILQIVHEKLEHEFEVTCTGNANPLKLLARTKRLQEELPRLREESDKLLAAKQDLIDAARTTLIRNRTLLCQLLARAGLSMASDTDDPINSFEKTLEEWDQQLDMHSGDYEVSIHGIFLFQLLRVTDSGQVERLDLNLELFRAKVFKSDSVSYSNP